MTVVLDNALFVKEAKYCVDRFGGRLCVNGVGGVGINRKGLGFPYLPIVIERRGIIRSGVPPEYIRQAEILSEFHVLKACFHHAHMRNKAPLHIETGKLYAELIIVYIFEKSVGNALCRFTQTVSRKHSVDIGVVG